MRAVLQRSDFRRLFAGLVFSMTAESVLLLALAIWAKDLTGSDGMAGAAILAVVAPMFFAPVIGFVVDRFRRKPFLVVVLFMSAVVLTPLLLIKGRDDLWMLYTVAVLYGLSFIAVSSALNGLIKVVVPDDLLAEANGALQTVKQGLRLIAPLAGAGLYVATKGWGLAVVGMTGFIIAALIISSLRTREDQPTRSELHWLGEVAVGLRHLRQTLPLRRAVVGLTIAIMVFGFGESVFFALVDQGLHKPPAFLSVIVSVQGIGGLLGGLAAARVIRRLGEIGTLALGTAMLIPMVVTSIWPTLWMVFPTIALAGLGLPFAIVGLMTLMQRLTPGEMMGRVSSAVEALLSGPQAISIALGAILVEQLDFRLLFAIMAVVTGFSAVYLWAGRKLSQPVHDQPVGDGTAIGEAELAR